MQAFQISVCDAKEAIQDPVLVTEWERLLSQSTIPNALYASPPWLAAQVEQNSSKIRVWTVRGERSELIGIVAVQVGVFDLQFSISTRTLARRTIPVGRVLGGLPVVPNSKLLYEKLLLELLRDLPDCAGLYFEALPTDAFFWLHIAGPRAPSPGHYWHVVDGPRPWHFVQFSSFDAYLKAMSSKARANVRREVRQLQEHAGGKLLLKRYFQPEDVGSFLKTTATVSQRSWQHRILGPRVLTNDRSKSYFESLARQGLLHSYLLMAGESPCAFVIGYRYAGIYHYAEVAYDETYSEYSPGTVLLYLILEDLHTCPNVKLLNFGIGDATYKRRFGNFECEDVSCLLLRNRIGLRLLTSGHAAFNRSVVLAKHLLNRRVTK